MRLITDHALICTDPAWLHDMIWFGSMTLKKDQSDVAAQTHNWQLLRISWINQRVKQLKEL